MVSEAVLMKTFPEIIFEAANIVFCSVIIHEAGHFIGGTISGHRFEFIRFFRVVIYRTDNRRIGIRTIGLNRKLGSFGQCIMTEKESSSEKDMTISAPCLLILAGGAANLAASLMWLVTLRASFHLRMLGFFINILMAAASLFPHGSNDGATAWELIRHPDRVGIYYSLMRIGAALEREETIDEMPGEWFEIGCLSCIAEPESMVRELSELRIKRSVSENESS